MYIKVKNTTDDMGTGDTWHPNVSSVTKLGEFTYSPQPPAAPLGGTWEDEVDVPWGITQAAGVELGQSFDSGSLITVFGDDESEGLYAVLQAVFENGSSLVYIVEMDQFQMYLLGETGATIDRLVP